MKYELSFIISANIPETEHQKIQGDILSYIEKAGAKASGNFNSLGRKKLAYPIKKQKNGFYMSIELVTEDSAGLTELDTRLKHNVNLLRYLVIRLDQIAIKQAARPPRVRRDPKAEVKIAEPLKPTTPEEKKKTLEDIDKRLDEILDSNID